MTIKPLLDRVVLKVEEAEERPKAVSSFHPPLRKSPSLLPLSL